MKAATGYIKIASHEARKGEFTKCLLLYSGGLDTSVMLKWIQEQYSCDVFALTVDIGQTADDLPAIREKALKLGAKEAIVYDAKVEFSQDLLSQAIKANADYQGGYALGCPLGRVIISKIAVKVAKQLNCQVIAHGCTGKGNDQVRFEGYITTLNPDLKIIAPVREWGMGRDEELAYAKEHNIPVKQTADKTYSYDENMWSNTAEGGEIEDPQKIPQYHKILQWCKTVEEAPNEPEYIKIQFKQGVPVAINGEEKNLVEIITLCNQIGGKHGCGVVTLIEDRIVGLKVRGVYENPAGALLIGAHKKLELLVSTREENEMKTLIDQKWAYLTYGAKWFDPLMDHLTAYINSQNLKVSGTVTLKLYKGQHTVVAVESANSLFNSDLATFNKNASFNQNSSAGFIELWNLPQKTAYNPAIYGNRGGNKL